MNNPAALLNQDLNGDGKDEYFVRFLSPYFYGTCGCTFLLMGHESEVITTFSVTDALIYISPEKKNGWNVLYYKSDEKFRKVIY